MSRGDEGGKGRERRVDVGLKVKVRLRVKRRVMVRVKGSIREISTYRPVRIFMQKANKTSLTDVAAIDGLVRGDLVIAWLGEMSMDI